MLPPEHSTWFQEQTESRASQFQRSAAPHWAHMSAAAALVASVGGAGGAGGGDGGGCPHGDTQSAPTLVQRSVSPSQIGKSPAHADWLLCPLSHTLADGVRHLPKCGEQYSVSLHAVGGVQPAPGTGSAHCWVSGQQIIPALAQTVGSSPHLLKYASRHRFVLGVLVEWGSSLGHRDGRRRRQPRQGGSGGRRRPNHTPLLAWGAPRQRDVARRRAHENQKESSHQRARGRFII
eukprot:SAG11_NODE_120_length_15879_cov_8.076933_5_plen_234_part_00